MDSSKPSESNQYSFMSVNKQSIDTNNLPIQMNSIKSEKKIVNINLTFIKQTLKSRLTTCQLILLILNILGILTIVIVTVILRKQPCSTNEMDSEGEYIKLSLVNLFILFRYFNNSTRPFLRTTT